MKRAAVLPAPRIDLPSPGEGKWEKERRAFHRLRPSLLRSHKGKYVAIHHCKVVDSGNDKIALAMRVYKRFGYIPIYVSQVLAEPRPPVRMPSPRLVKLANTWVTRYRYNHQVDPPAPFVYVTLLRPVGDEAIADIAAQLDTAADRTVVPLHLIEELGLVPLDEMKVIGFGGIVANVRTFSLRLALRDFAPVTLEVFGNNAEPHVLLGRDVLNRYRVLLDGPEGMLEVS